MLQLLGSAEWQRFNVVGLYTYPPSFQENKTIVRTFISVSASTFRAVAEISWSGAQPKVGAHPGGVGVWTGKRATITDEVRS